MHNRLITSLFSIGLAACGGKPIEKPQQAEAVVPTITAPKFIGPGVNEAVHHIKNKCGPFVGEPFLKRDFEGQERPISIDPSRWSFARVPNTVGNRECVDGALSEIGSPTTGSCTVTPWSENDTGSRVRLVVECFGPEEK